MPASGLRPFLALAAAALAADASAEVREVGAFTGVLANNGIVVHSNVSVDGNTSVSIQASAALLSQVRTLVDRSGTLVLSMVPGASGSGVVANVRVPGPLSYAGASTDSQLIADAVSGTVIATSGGQLAVESLRASHPVRVTASSGSRVLVSSGSVGFVTMSCSSASAMHLGRLQANFAVISVSAKSKVSGVTVDIAQITAASQSSVSLNASRTVSLSCSSSDVTISGSAVVTTLSQASCQMARTAKLAANRVPREALPMGPFTGIHAGDGIEVHSHISANDSASVHVEGSADALQKVRSSVDGFGTLVLSLALGRSGSGVVARVSVPGPLSYAGASAGGQLLADEVSGTIAVSSGGRLTAQTLTASRPVSITASSGSEIAVIDGSLSFVSVACSSNSAVHLGRLRAESAVLSVSASSSVSGMTVDTAQITAASASSVSVMATRQVSLTCSNSDVHVGGAATVTTLSSSACRVNHTGSAAVPAFYP